MTCVATELERETGGVPERCRDCEVRRVALCGQVDAAALRKLNMLSHTERLSAGSTLLWESEPSEVVGIVRTGLLKLTASLEDGREQTLGLAFPGDFVGRPFASEVEYSITAIADSTVCTFNRARFEALAADVPHLQQALLTRVFKDLDRARRWMMLLGRKSAGERVACLLLETAEVNGAGPGESVPLPLSRQQMADVLGLTIETVSRKMHLFARSGVIGLPSLRSFTVERPAELARLAA